MVSYQYLSLLKGGKISIFIAFSMIWLVACRKRYVYCFTSQEEGPGLNAPLTIDYTGTYFRRDGLGGTYIGGLSPLPEEEPPTNNLDVDHQYFDDQVWPNLARLVPAFNGVKVTS